MVKYVIEGGMNFYEELYKSLDDTDVSDSVSVCCISNQPLTPSFVTLECNHKFNYDTLYKEICQQKFVFKTYRYEDLNDADRIKCKLEGFDFYIRCPYCRHVQYSILPYYPEYKKIYGINTLDHGHNDVLLILPSGSKPYDYEHKYKGYVFKKIEGKCCSNVTNNKSCNNKVITDFDSTQYLCYDHLDSELLSIKQKKQEEKMKAKQERLKLKEEKEKIRQDKIKLKEEKIKLKEEKPKAKVIIDLTENVVLESTINGCQSIIKTGNNKGQLCGAKIFIPNCCKRHTPKI
jgi:hypothetical protein